VANHKSAKKRARSSANKRLRNRQYVSTVRTAVKKFQLALNTVRAGASGVDAASLPKLFAEAQSLLGRAAAKGILHKNNAARRISRLAASLKDLSAAAATASAPKKASTKVVAPKAAKPVAAPKAAKTATKTAAPKKTTAKPKTTK